MKKRMLRRIGVMGLTICTVISAMPVQAENLVSHEEKEEVQVIAEVERSDETETGEVSEVEEETTEEGTTEEGTTEEGTTEEGTTEEETTEEGTTEEIITEETTTEIDTFSARSVAENSQEIERILYYDFEEASNEMYQLEKDAKIVEDEERGNVLQLPGNGSLTLPESLFEDLGNQGFTMAMWVKTDASTGSYTKLFDASNAPLGETYGGENGSWSDPDFGIAAGGDVYDMTLYVGQAGKSTNVSTKLKYDEHLARGKWQHIAISMDQDEYHVYFDGEEIDYADAQDNTQSVQKVLPKLFADGYLASLKYASIGKSYYTSDADFKGDVDDISFYNGVLSEDRIREMCGAKVEQEEDIVAERILYYDFEKEADTSYILQNQAEVMEDEQKGNVLHLPGNGSLTLPEDLFEQLGTDGFTISMWVKPDSSTGNYTKVFDASNAPLGETYAGQSDCWMNPDFGIAAGGDAYDLTLYIGEPESICSTYSKLKYHKHLDKGKWQHMAVSISPEEYHVYFDGKEITYDDGQDGTQSIQEVLPKLFADGYLASLKYASIGKSYYTSDADFKGDVDDIAFYNGALSAGAVKKLYNSFDKLKEIDHTATMTVDMTKKTGAVKHGATGFLYGVGEDNVPDVNLLTAIKPYMCEQKPAEGLQHPNGDILSMANTFIEAGGDSIQIACPDIYANWPYEFESIEEYCEKLKIMVEQVRDAGLSDKAVYVLYNEPEGNWFGEIWNNDMSKFTAAWKQAYDAVKSVDPNARVAGPNFSVYMGRQMRTYMEFCAENNCIPDQITWHVLGDSQYIDFHNHVAQFREYEKELWLDPGKTTEEMEIVINEYAEFTQLGVPGHLARWIGVFEDEKATACLAYWHISNNLCDLAASNNEPNGAWWLYKWYAEMSGETLKIATRGLEQTKFYGVASLDENKKVANVILGGADDVAKVTLKNIADTGIYTEKVKVKFESTNWTGINGAAEAPFFIKEEVYQVNENGDVEIRMENLVAAAAYNLTITPVSDEVQEGITKQGAWQKTYEAEEAYLGGNVRQAGKNWSFACSGTGQAQGIGLTSDYVSFDVEVPQDGYYRFDMVYGAATGNDTQNTSRNNPKNAEQILYVDDEKITNMYLENTLTWYMSGLHTEYFYLTKGSHAIKVTGGNSEGQSSMDCMYLTFVGDEEALYAEQNVKRYEAELSDFNVLGNQNDTSVSTQTATAGYSGAGYTVGLNTSVKEGGGIRFTTFVHQNGMYDVKVRYASDRLADMNFYVNNTNVTLDKLVATEQLQATNGAWEEICTKVFLKKGINIIDLDTNHAGVAVDTLIIETRENQEETVIIEAEDCKLIGDVLVSSNDNASAGQYVKEILASENAENALLIEYDAEKAGTYAMVVYQSNKELFGSHDYNAQMVDRFITMEVNGKEAQNVYFRNTYSDDSFRSQCVMIELEKGKNEIKIYNNNYRVHKNGVNGVNECINYTPNIDKFEFTCSVASASVVEEDKKEDNKVDNKEETKQDQSSGSSSSGGDQQNSTSGGNNTDLTKKENAAPVVPDNKATIEDQQVALDATVVQPTIPKTSNKIATNIKKNDSVEEMEAQSTEEVVLEGSEIEETVISEEEIALAVTPESADSSEEKIVAEQDVKQDEKAELVINEIPAKSNHTNENNSQVVFPVVVFIAILAAGSIGIVLYKRKMKQS